ncbi:class I SAM-dependent methyltransferase [soil metagenome]
MNKFVAALIGLKLWLVLVAATLLVSNNSVESQTASFSGYPTPTPAIADKITRRTSDPFTGDLSRFEDPERDKNLQPDRVMDILNIREGRSVADIGAGSGWFTVRAARRVGPSGQVFAVEINSAFVDLVTKRAQTEGLKNVKAVLGKADDPTLPANSVDAVLFLKSYHEIAEPVALMKKVKTALRKDGLVGIIDRNGDGADHGLDESTLINEMKLAGFVLKEKHDFVKPDEMDYFLVFKSQ